MRVVVEPEVFASVRIPRMSLIVLITEGSKSPHTVHVEDETCEPFQQWLAAQEPVLRGECQALLDLAYKRDAQAPSRREVRVADLNASDWEASPPRLTIADTLHTLRRPFAIIVESNKSDRAFLLSMATRRQRDYLEQVEGRERLRFVNGGGITNLKHDINKVKALPGARLRSFALFDSDALRRDHPHPHSQRVRELCEQEPSVQHHQLIRRSAENYLPVSALQAYIDAKPNRRALAPALRAYRDMRPEQRHYFNMAKGLSGDSERLKKRGESTGGLFDELDDDARDALDKGFRGDVKDEFVRRYETGQSIPEHELRQDGGWHEINPLVTAIVAML